MDLLLAILWHVVAVQDMSKNIHTHVQVTGYVTYVKKEEDGDQHIRICDSPSVKTMDRAHCVVAEAIPKLPMRKVRVGEKITVRGISRFDKERNHNWWEVHPIEEIR